MQIISGPAARLKLVLVRGPPRRVSTPCCSYSASCAQPFLPLRQTYLLLCTVSQLHSLAAETVSSRHSTVECFRLYQNHRFEGAVPTVPVPGNMQNLHLVPYRWSGGPQQSFTGHNKELTLTNTISRCELHRHHIQRHRQRRETASVPGPGKCQPPPATTSRRQQTQPSIHSIYIHLRIPSSRLCPVAWRGSSSTTLSWKTEHNDYPGECCRQCYRPSCK